MLDSSGNLALEESRQPAQTSELGPVVLLRAANGT